MLNAYIRSTCGAVKWLLFAVFVFLGPVIRGIFIFGAIGSALGVLLFLLGWLESPAGLEATIGNGKAATAIWHPLLISTVLMFGCIAGLIFYEIKSASMMTERISEVFEEDAPEPWKRVRNWLAALALIGALSAVFWFAVRPVFGPEAVFAGVALFYVIGIILGIIRWFHVKGTDAWAGVGYTARSSKAVFGRWMGKVKSLVPARKTKVSKMSDDELRAAAEAFVEDLTVTTKAEDVVVPFRRKA